MKLNLNINNVILVFFALFGLSYILGEFFIDLSILNMSASETYLEWGVRVARDIGWYGALITALSYGVFTLRRIGLGASFKYISGGLCGFVISIVMATYSLHIAESTLSSLKPPEKIVQVVNQAYNDSSFSLEARHQVTLLHARSSYVMGEDLQKFIALDGSLIDYEPTPKERIYRKNALHHKATIIWWIEGLRGSIGVTFGAFLLACMVGLIASGICGRKCV
jgi:hypothetical protein